MKLGVALALSENCYCENYFVFEVDRQKTLHTHHQLALEDKGDYLVGRTLQISFPEDPPPLEEQKSTPLPEPDSKVRRHSDKERKNSTSSKKEGRRSLPESNSILELVSIRDYVWELVSLSKRLPEIKASIVGGSMISGIFNTNSSDPEYSQYQLENPEVVRIYNELFMLRRVLTHNYPGCFVANLPSKKLFVKRPREDGRLMLKQWVRRLHEGSVAIYESDIFSKQVSLGVSLHSSLKNMLNPKVSETLSRYKDVFKHLEGKSVGEAEMQKIYTFQTYITENRDFLKKSVAQTERMMESYTQEKQNLNKMMEGFYKVEMLYKACFDEKNLDQEDPDKVVNEALQGAGHQDMLDFNFSQQDNPFKEMWCFLSQELLDYDAFLQALAQLNQHLAYKQKVRKKLEKHLELVGAVNVGTGGGGKNVQMYEELQEQFEQITLLCNIIVLNLALDEVERFKIDKYRHYCEQFKQFCTTSLRTFHETRGLFKFLTDYIEFNKPGL